MLAIKPLSFSDITTRLSSEFKRPLSEARPMNDRLNDKQIFRELKLVESTLKARLLERHREIEGILLAVLTDSPCFFLGLPGTGKTQLIDTAALLLGLSTFDVLMSDSIKPSDIFGPADVPALAKGTQRLKTKGYAADCNVLFFDEVFKANGIVLNPLLWLMNEHKFRNGDEGVIRCPTISIFGASNELPSDDGLAALYDRFLLRYEVHYLRNPRSIQKLFKLHLSDPDVDHETLQPILNLEAVKRLRYLVKKVEMPEEVLYAVEDIRKQIDRTLKIKISDRRISKSLRLLQARAFLRGRSVVRMSDTEVLSNVFWEKPEQINRVRSIVEGHTNLQAGDLFSYDENSENVFTVAIQSGEIDSALEKLMAMKKGITKFKTASSKEVRSKIEVRIAHLKGIKQQREQFIVTQMHGERGYYFRISPATAQLWSKQQLRKVGAHWFNAEAYWWISAGTLKMGLKKQRLALKDDVLQQLGVNLVVNKLI